MKHRTLSRLFAVATLAVSLAAATPAKAATIQLGFILDSSGSIGAVIGASSPTASRPRSTRTFLSAGRTRTKSQW